MNLGRIDYASPVVPEAYRCTTCGIHGCKLWREAQIMYTDLACCACAGRLAERGVSTIGPDGRRFEADGHTTDQIGYWLPAVPTQDGDGFWGYTSVPEPGVQRWRRLPTRVPQ